MVDHSGWVLVLIVFSKEIEKGFRIQETEKKQIKINSDPCNKQYQESFNFKS